MRRSHRINLHQSVVLPDNALDVVALRAARAALKTWALIPVAQTPAARAKIVMVGAGSDPNHAIFGR